MANAEHVQRLMQGVSVWNVWKHDNLITRIDLRNATLSGRDLTGVDLSRTDLTGADLSRTNLTGADLRGTTLSRANLKGATLSRVDFRQTNLVEANLNETSLTDARLWEIQRTGWSIQSIRCEAVYLDKDGKERTTYKPGEFERSYADKAGKRFPWENENEASLPSLDRACRVMEVGDTGQRFQPKEHQGLVLG
jgi:uncharacterized protein YjbI with pentapeptide repeats